VPDGANDERTKSTTRGTAKSEKWISLDVPLCFDPFEPKELKSPGVSELIALQGVSV
jgi:hypothetical protein